MVGKTDRVEAVEQDEYVLRSVDVEHDAERLAAMWQASDDQWPGTWSGGLEMTAQRVRESLLREKYIDALVWDTGDAIAGFCSLWDYPEETNVTYIATLNVAPQYQKKSLGRKFLLHYIDRVIGRGSSRLDLHTWSGNLKAMPLYKKCGFFWMPGTSVHMFNYLPSILVMPATQPFFKKHDWYRSFKRELAQIEDDERWEGLKVFTYRFEENGEVLTVWIDREARTVAGIETDAFFAAVIAEDIEPARGLPARLRWKVQNKQDVPIQLSLIANGTTGFALDYRTSFEVGAGATVELDAEVNVALDAPSVADDKPAPAVRSLLVMDGQVLELGVGLRPRAAIEVSTEPAAITIMPGIAQTVLLCLHSRLKQTITATVTIAPEPGLVADWKTHDVVFDAGGYASFPIQLQADHAGVWRMPVGMSFDVAGTRVSLPMCDQAIFALPLGGVLGAMVDGKLRIENDTARLVMEPEGGGLSINDRVQNKWLAHQVGHTAPPAWPNEYRDGKHELRLERVADGYVATATMASKEHPGFVLRKIVTVGSGPVVRIDYDFDNLHGDERSFRLMQAVFGDDGKSSVILPLRAGLGRGPWAEFPGSIDDQMKQAGSFAEQWCARESDAATLGMIWSTDVEVLEWGTSNLITGLYRCPPQSQMRPGSLHLYIGDGGWRSVQKIWQRLHGVTISNDVKVCEPQTPLSLRLEQSVIAHNGEATATLLVESLLSRPVDGHILLSLPEGWHTERQEWDFTGLTWQNPFRVALHLTTTAPVGAHVGHLTLRSTEWDADIDVPLIRLGTGSDVVVRPIERDEQQIWSVDNGRIALDVTPQFAGTVSALREGATNHLYSAFPKIATLGWMSPWYGGIQPILNPDDEDRLPGSLWQEYFTAEVLEQDVALGGDWRGVRQTATLEREPLKGLRLELETLTVGGSCVVKLVMRIINTTSAPRRLSSAGWLVFTQPDGSRAATILHNVELARKHSDRIAWIRAPHWAAAQNPETGHSLVMVSSRPWLNIVGWGKDGDHFALHHPLVVPPDNSAEIVAYLTLAETLDEARRFAVLVEGNTR